MEIIRRTRNILVKTQRKLVIRQAASEEGFDCDHCGLPMITAQTAAVLHNISTLDVYRMVEKGKLHFIETDSKAVFVCSNFGDLVSSAINFESSSGNAPA